MGRYGGAFLHPNLRVLYIYAKISYLEDAGRSTGGFEIFNCAEHFVQKIVSELNASGQLIDFIPVGTYSTNMVRTMN